MAFTAKDVQALRAKTGVGMMDCKKALTEADGDMDKAIDCLRKRGLAAAAKKAGRIAAEGSVLAYYDEKNKTGVLVEVNSETDFVAKNDKFKELVANTAKTIAAANPEDVEALNKLKMFGSDRTVAENFQDAILAIGENMKIRRFIRAEGDIAIYIHGGGSEGVLVVFDTDPVAAAKDEFKTMGKNIAMQIAAMNPSYLCAASVPADVIAHEKEINLAQIKENPKMAEKPEKVIDGIISGKIAKFCKETCLLEQSYVKDADIDVKAYIASVSKELGSDIKVKEFFHYTRGEGLQKREDDFASEVAGMMK